MDRTQFIDLVRLSAGACAAGVDAVLDGTVDNIYVLCRPAGHHATRDFGRGFCIFSNIPIAILRAQAASKVRRVAVLDWDVHHGNGTQEAFYHDPNVLTISIHQAGNYPPGSGGMEDTGEGRGAGYNINVPLPPGSGHGAYLETMTRVVVPALQAYRPELIVVASGLDASTMDPLARMMCYSETYRHDDAHVEARRRRALPRKTRPVSRRRLFVGVRAVVRARHPRRALRNCHLVPRSLFGSVRAWPYQELQPHQTEVIARAAGLVSRIQQR